MDHFDPSMPVRGLECSICDCTDMEKSLAQIEDSALKGCQRCKLLGLSASAFQDYWSEDVQDNRGEVLVVVQRGLLSSSAAKVSIHWMSASNSQTRRLQLSISGQEEWDIPWPEFTIRNVPSSDPKSQQCLKFIKDQILSCASHENCGESRAAMFLNKSGNKIQNPTRLLKIVNHGSELSVLLTNTSDAKYTYTALSHCWGTQEQAKKIPTLDRDNLEQRLLAAMSVSSLTRTFQDAIELTASLGYEYIWIDSLCIIQGDQADWKKECGKMGEVYGGAYLVIAAAYAKDGNGGLFADRQAARRIEFKSSAGHAIKASVSAHRGEIDKHDIWKTGDQYWIAEDLPLFTRAWAFQERMLAKRIIHFTSSELVWECRSSATCECGDLSDGRTSWPQFGPRKTIKTKYQDVIDWGHNFERMEFWDDIAAQYSARDITKNSDRLPALASIAKQIDCCGMLGRYLCGIWEETLPHSLLWWSEFKDLKHFPRSDQQAITHFRPAVKCIPSWSWLSIEGRVSLWGRAATVHVEVTDIAFTLPGNDPYGESAEAAITLRGFTTLVVIYSSPQPNGSSAVIVVDPISRQEFSLDADTNPFEFSDSELWGVPFKALAFSSSGRGDLCCLILRQAPDRLDRYQRIGVAYLSETVFESASFDDIVMI
ncbi:hypothetical protein FIE12Z_11947 [Fusarium flagelliforme]|uniref:Heterokaryon incompatibility domain-containing protein n=1 Tax=Fusarium flagelliforme TaxID=2675880 RepID=A0A395M7I3_9HYPO|nr:hypothetical protein FIE12Z_11947 [Fusarium flagelliforme]